MAMFGGSILLALLEKCSVERIWVLIKRVKETLVARFPDSHETSLTALNPYRHTNASCICCNTEISGLVGSKGLIKVFILALIVRRGKNGPNGLKSEFCLGTAGSRKRALNRDVVFLDCPLKRMLLLPFPPGLGGTRLFGLIRKRSSTDVWRGRSSSSALEKMHALWWVLRGS